MIRVHLASPYYDVGHEQGDLPLIIAVAEWLEQNIPQSEIHYCSDFAYNYCLDVPTRFGRAERKRLWKHFCRVGHLPYRFSEVALGQAGREWVMQVVNGSAAETPLKVADLARLATGGRGVEV